MRINVALLLLVGLVGCAPRQPAKVDCGIFGTGTRLSNGTVELLIVPNIGRVMRYGYVDGRNVLFVDPANREKPPTGQFISYGGDKAWIWPQDDWQKYIGRSFPPPQAVDGQPWTLKILSPRSVRMTSGVIEPWGMRLERDIRLDDSGTRVTLTNRLIKFDSRSSPPTATWSVTQIPVADEVWVRGTGDGTVAQQPMMRDPWKAVEQHGRWLRLRRDPSVLSKTGVAGNQIVVSVGTTRFIQTLLSTDPPGAPAGPEQAQIFSFADPGGDHPTQVPYTELEFTSPRTVKADRPQVVTMTVSWELAPR